jgi:hypothetical protein
VAEYDDFGFGLEGDCPDCDGTGEVACECDDRGCSRCLDGLRTCEECGGSGYREPAPVEDET